MGRKDGIGNGRIFSARQYQFTTDIPKEKVQIRDKFAQRCFFVAVRRAPVNDNAFSVALFLKRKKSDRNRNRRKVSKNRRIVVFRVEAVWNNKIIQGKREVLRDDYKT